MKPANLLAAFFLLFGFAVAAAQETSAPAEKWTRFETADKRFSVALPPDAIVDAEERKYGQIFRAVGYRNGVETELTIIKDKNVKDRPLNILPVESKKMTSFKLGEFSIVKIEPRTPSGDRFENTFRIIRNDFLFILNISARTVQAKEVARVLTSITIDGKPFVVQANKPDSPEETVSIAAVKSSPEIAEAFDRKLRKNKINVTYEVANGAEEIAETEGMTRPVVILDRPYPVLDPGLSVSGTFDVKLKVKFLSNGQVGDIVVLSAVSKEISKICIEAAQKIRFVPARANGTNIDGARVVDYKIILFDVPRPMPR